jgi:superfamily II DNA/RNA helicase
MLARDVSFASLGVPAPLVAVLDEDGITAPFPIQAATLPDALAGQDILGRAKTGSGKTLGFSLPLVARLAGGVTAPGRPRGLVLVPTRELATQVQGVLVPLARALGLRVATVYGGVSYRPQVAALQRRTDVLVACPGRLADLMGQGHCDLGDVEVTVIDEADQMADLGFLPIVRRLLEATPSDGQRLLFSATLDSAIDVLARRFLRDPALHSVDEDSSPAEIEHHVLTIDPAHRLDVVAALAGGQKRSLVFTRTKHGAQRLARQLCTAGIPAAELHGNLTQAARSRNLAAFGTGAVRVMVATDIAARGIHVDGVDLVIHADPPSEHKAYVHRSGRTARAGAAGVVVTMQTSSQAREVRKLLRAAGVTPHEATASPESEALRSIAGPPAPRTMLTTKVTDLVKPAERLTRPRVGAGEPGRPRGRKARTERPRGREGHAQRWAREDQRRDRFGGSERSDDRDRPGQRERSDDRDRPGQRERSDGRDARYGQRERSDDRDRYGQRERSDGRDARYSGPDPLGRRERANRPDRAARNESGARHDRAARHEPAQHGGQDRFGQRDRPAGRERPPGERARSERPAQFDGAGRSSGDRAGGDRAHGDRAGGDRARGDRDWAPYDRPRAQRAAGNRQPSGTYRGPSRGGGRGGTTTRPGYTGRRSPGGKRRNPGQGRHS